VPERYLIVNADDFGRSAEVNAGILRAYEGGVVTSASLMVRWPAAEDAAAYAREHPSLAVGLHLDLGEWTYRDPAWEGEYEVVAPDDAEAVEAEVRSQLEDCRRLLGRDPTHIDSHQHIHLKENAVGDAARRVAHELSVPLRQRDTRVRYCGSFYGQSAEGQALHDAITPEHLIELVNGIGEGITEFACHPGDGGPGGYDHERRLEVEALCDPGVRQAIERSGVVLRSFGDLGGRK
jgi:predicted glycoside hydrolase/deacetylase ChbG (UPF0249 family)